MKPDPRLFAHVRDLAAGALRQLTADAGPPLAPADVLYVGDSYHSDVVGGTGAGWPVAWFRGDSERAPAGAFVFSDWRELLDRLGLVAG